MFRFCLLWSVFFAVESLGSTSGAEESSPLLPSAGVESGVRKDVSPSVRKAGKSVVQLVLHRSGAGERSRVPAGVGWIMEDSHGNRLLVTAFHIVEKAFSEGWEGFAVKYKNQVLPLKGIRAVLPVFNLAFLELPEQTKKVSFENPLKIDLAQRSEESLWTVGFSGDTMQFVALGSPTSLNERFGFLADTLDLSGLLGGPVLNEEGRVTAVMTERLFNYGFGASVSHLTDQIVCSGSPGDCIMEARKNLYEEAKGGSLQAQYRVVTNYPYTILRYGSEETPSEMFHKLSVGENIRNFMHSAGGVSDFSRMQEEYASWFHRVAMNYIEEQYEHALLTANPEEGDRFLNALFAREDKEYPPAQYLEGVVLFKGLFGVFPDVSGALDIFKVMAEQGFIPAYDGLGRAYQDLADNWRQSLILTDGETRAFNSSDFLSAAQAAFQVADRAGYYQCRTAFHIN